MIGRSEGMYLGSDYMPMFKEATGCLTVLGDNMKYITKQELDCLKIGNNHDLHIKLKLHEYDL